MADLRTLDRRLYPWAKWLYDVGKYYDGRLTVTSAYRSYAHQDRLYRRWLTGEATIPAAPPGRSLHQRGLAFDFSRFGVDPHKDELLVFLGNTWNAVGGKWGGARDPVHFSVPV